MGHHYQRVCHQSLVHNCDSVRTSVLPLYASVSSVCLVSHSALDGNQHPSVGSPSSAANDTGSSCNVSERNQNIFLNEHFQEAFGATLINGEGEPDSETHSIWWKVVALRGKQYALPDKNVGTRFINILAEEIEKCTRRSRHQRKSLYSQLLRCNETSWCGKEKIFDPYR